MLDDVWRFFLKIDESTEDSVSDVLSEQQWNWLIQTKKLEETEEIRNFIVSTSISEIALKIAMRSEVYHMKICENPRRIVGKFSEGFVSRNFHDLKLLVEEYISYLEILDEAIHEIKDVQFNGFLVDGIEFDEYDNEMLVVELTEQVTKEKLKLTVNYTNVREFPKALYTSRSSNFECERWNTDDRLGINLLKLFESDKSHENGIVDNGKFDDVDDETDDKFMDFV